MSLASTLTLPAALDWAAEKVDLFTHTLDPVPTHRAIRRSDTGAILGVVGEGYTPVQNHDLMDYIADLSAHAPDLRIVGSGCIDNGRRVYIEAEVPTLAIVLGDDVTQFRFTITNGHAGNGAISARGVYFRTRCTNRLAAADRKTYNELNKLSIGTSFRHTRYVKDRMADVAHAFRRTMSEHEVTVMAYRALASKPSTEQTLASIIAAAWPVILDPDTKCEADRARAIRLNREETVKEIRRSPTCNVNGTAGTVFSDLQAVTEYVDHKSQKDDAKRFASANFGGAGEEAKERAWSAALALTLA